MDQRTSTGGRCGELMRALLGALVLSLALGACGSSSDDGGESCAPKAGQCPNFCTVGTGVKDEVCSSKDDCACGLFCKAGSCAPYEGDNAGCACEAAADGTDATDGTDGADGTDATDGADGADGTVGDINDCEKTAPPGADCNPYCQLGCKDERQCTFGNGDFYCSQTGSAGIGESCNNSSDCVAGMACFSLTGDPGNTCRKFCIDDGDCSDGRRCDLNVNFQGGAASASFCGDISIGCDPFETPTTCPEGQACYLNNQATKCLPAGELEAGELCRTAGPGACKAGLQCLIVCTEICNVLEVNPGEPKCTAACEGSFDAVHDDSGMGICLGAEAPAECDLFAQTGCAGGEACYPLTGGHGCTAAGTIKLGESCQFTNDCEPGAICINQQCQQACNAKEDAPADQACSAICDDFNSITPQEWGVGFCTDAEPAEPCDFWAQDCSEPGDACYFVSNGATCLPTNSQGMAGDSCQFVQDCAGGFVCFQSECVEPCSIDELNPKACTALCPDSKFEPINIDNQIGVCTE